MKLKLEKIKIKKYINLNWFLNWNLWTSHFWQLEFSELIKCLQSNISNLVMSSLFVYTAGDISVSLWKYQPASSQESFVWMKTIKNGQQVIKLVIDRRIASGIQGCRIITLGNLSFTTHAFWISKGLSQEKSWQVYCLNLTK